MANANVTVCKEPQKATGDSKKLPENSMWRINYAGTCGGPGLWVSMEESKRDTDIFVEKDGIKVVYDTNFEQYVGDDPIDWVKFLLSCGEA